MNARKYDLDISRVSAVENKKSNAIFLMSECRTKFLVKALNFLIIRYDFAETNRARGRSGVMV